MQKRNYNKDLKIEKEQQYKAILEKLENVPVTGLFKDIYERKRYKPSLIFEDIYETKQRYKNSLNCAGFKELLILGIKTERRWELEILEDHGWEIDISPTCFKRRKDYKGIKYEFEND